MLMLISTILGQTQYNLIQITLELIIAFILVINLIKNKYTKFELGIIYIYLFTSILSFLFNSISTFLIQAKLSGLTILVILYATKNDLRNINFLSSIYWINICLIFFELLTGNPLISKELIGAWSNNLNLRPSGIFIIPHVSITYIAIYLIYKLEIPKSRFSLVTIISGLIAMFFSGLGTGFYAFIIWYIISRTSRIPILKYFSNGYILLLTAFLLIFLANLYIDDVISFVKHNIPRSRYFTLAMVLPELIDIDRMMLITNLIPKSIASPDAGVIILEGPEVGYWTLFQGNGFFLGMSLIIFTTRYIKTYKIFILLTLIHYSFYFINPFILVASMIFNKEIEVFRLQHSLQKW